jgi:hypothetical protein
MTEIEYVRHHAKKDAERAFVALATLRESEALMHSVKFFRPYKSWSPWFQRHVLFNRRARKLDYMRNAGRRERGGDDE